MDYFFVFISILMVLSVIVFFLTLLFQIFSRNKQHNDIAKKYMIYAVIAFLIGFGSCVTGIVFFGG